MHKLWWSALSWFSAIHWPQQCTFSGILSGGRYDSNNFTMEKNGFCRLANIWKMVLCAFSSMELNQALLSSSTANKQKKNIYWDCLICFLDLSCPNNSLLHVWTEISLSLLWSCKQNYTDSEGMLPLGHPVNVGHTKSLLLLLLMARPFLLSGNSIPSC